MAIDLVFIRFNNADIDACMFQINMHTVLTSAVHGAGDDYHFGTQYRSY